MSGRLHVAHVESASLFRIEGHGTARESVAFYSRAVKDLANESCRLTLDLSACDYLDSTFIGCLFELYKQFAHDAPDRFVLAGTSDHCRSLLGQTQLHKLLRLVEAAPDTKGFEEVSCDSIAPAAFGRHVMESHTRLAEIEGPQQSVFRGIADEMARELKEQDTPE